MNFLQYPARILRRATLGRGATVGASDGRSSPPVAQGLLGWVRCEIHETRGDCNDQFKTILCQQETFACIGQGCGVACRTGIYHRDPRTAGTDCVAQQLEDVDRAKHVSDRFGRRGDDSFRVRASRICRVAVASVGFSAHVFSRPVCAAGWRGRVAAADVLIAGTRCWNAAAARRIPVRATSGGQKRQRLHWATEPDRSCRAPDAQRIYPTAATFRCSAPFMALRNRRCRCPCRR